MSRGNVFFLLTQLQQHPEPGRWSGLTLNLILNDGAGQWRMEIRVATRGRQVADLFCVWLTKTKKEYLFSSRITHLCQLSWNCRQQLTSILVLIRGLRWEWRMELCIMLMQANGDSIRGPGCEHQQELLPALSSGSRDNGA